MNEIDLERKLDVAAIILEKYAEIHNKVQTAATLNALGLILEDIFTLLKDKMITISYCSLMVEYAYFYKRQKPQIMNVGPGKIIYNPDGAADLRPYAGLTKEMYDELMKKGSVQVNILDYADTIDEKLSPLKFMNFKIAINGNKLQRFLQHYNRVVPFAFADTIAPKKVDKSNHEDPLLSETPDIKNKKQKSKKIDHEFIREIICVRPSSGSNRFKIVVNGNYLGFITADMVKPSWDLLFKVADEKRVFCDSKSQYKNSLDYFNTNKNNKIYTQTSHKLTKILKMEGEYIFAEDWVTINVASEKSFKTQYNKLLKSAEE